MRGADGTSALHLADDVLGVMSSMLPEIDEMNQWTLVLLCTDENSLLQRFNVLPHKCLVVDVTEKEDFTSETGFQYAKSKIDASRRVAVLASFPCTGGSPLNQGTNSVNPQCQDLLQQHEEEFVKLWNNFRRLIDECAPFSIIIEWPRCCSYWNRPEVIEVLSELGTFDAVFDGCMYGIVNKKAEPLQKQWRFATTIPEVALYFDILCQKKLV